MGRSRKGVELFASTSKYKDAMFKLANLPVLRSLLKHILVARGAGFTFIPVHEGVELYGGTAMPFSVVEHFINHAQHHVILDFCPCRRSFYCKEYPVGRGCTFIGEGAREIDPGVGRHVSKEEALDYLRAGTEMGLVPVIGKIDFDVVMLGVKERDRLMTICQCCPCCCLTTALHYASRGVRDIVTRLEGVEVKVTGDCIGCGACVEACIFKQMRIIEGRAVVGEECKGCGRCAAACEAGAVRITVNDSEYIKACIDRIGAHVDVG
jgi:ferredoxin